MKASIDIPYWGEKSLEAYALAAVEADRKQRFEKGEALQRYKECGADEEPDPIERLRFYCSLAMSGQDWLDVEPFFDAVIADRQRRKPQHINPELKAATEYAATTRSPVAITNDGRGVMLNYGDEEDRMAEHEDNACAYCGGSGHQCDVADRRD